MQLRCLDRILQHLNRIHQSDTVMVISLFSKMPDIESGRLLWNYKMLL